MILTYAGWFTWIMITFSFLISALLMYPYHTSDFVGHDYLEFCISVSIVILWIPTTIFYFYCFMERNEKKDK